MWGQKESPSYDRRSALSILLLKWLSFLYQISLDCLFRTMSPCSCRFVNILMLPTLFHLSLCQSLPEYPANLNCSQNGSAWEKFLLSFPPQEHLDNKSRCLILKKKSLWLSPRSHYLLLWGGEKVSVEKVQLALSTANHKRQHALCSPPQEELCLQKSCKLGWDSHGFPAKAGSVRLRLEGTGGLFQVHSESLSEGHGAPGPELECRDPTHTEEPQQQKLALTFQLCLLPSVPGSVKSFSSHSVLF